MTMKLEQRDPRAMLQAYLEAHGLTVHGWAVSHGLDPSEMNKVMRGVRKRLSAKMAFEIEDATEGAVPARAWATS